VTATRAAAATGWHRPGSLAEAAALTASGATPVGGGTLVMSEAFDVIPGPYLDLSLVVPAGCHGDRVGAMTTLAALLEMTDGRWPAIADAVRSMASPGVRRLATVGGTVAARLAGCDLAAPLAAHGASVISADADGAAHETPFTEFWSGAPGPGIITEIVLGPPRPGAYRRYGGRRGPAPALAGVAGVTSAGGIELWAGAVAGRPLRLAGQPLADSDLRGDSRCSARHRLRLVRALAAEVTSALPEYPGG
jgi:aerobic carbon-monoxide dehydrogenase medium subunit